MEGNMQNGFKLLFSIFVIVSSFQHYLLQAEILENINDLPPFATGLTAAFCIPNLAHEFGHAGMGRIFGYPMKISIGGNPNEKPIAKLGPISLRGYNPTKWFASIPDKLPLYQEVAISAAGPLTSLISSLLLSKFTNDPLLKSVFYGSALVELTNFIPCKKNEIFSDGGNIVNAYCNQTQTNKITSIGNKIFPIAAASAILPLALLITSDITSYFKTTI